jgi:hypothetical protein
MQNESIGNPALSFADFATTREACGDELVLQPAVLAVHAWDLHVEDCNVCLVDGNDLCYEGRYLQDEVADRRASAVIGRGNSAGPTFHPRRRPLPAFTAVRA